MFKLNWDSDFFQLNIGEIDLKFINVIPKSLDFDLIYLKNSKDVHFEISDFYLNHEENRVIFSKTIENQEIIELTVKDYDEFPIENKKLYSIAFESGKYSRFNLDTNFSNLDFEKLYSVWVDKSITKEIADKLFYLDFKGEVIGFITLKRDNSDGIIGLFAIDQRYQGNGLGSNLLKAVELYCMQNEIKKICIPTQKENIPACTFYSKLGYLIIEEINIKHFWKRN
jgi:dTDP-4-amino-4,6-dideoxy-D-galactose acyltransferase